MARINKYGIISGKLNGMIYYERDGKQYVKNAPKNTVDKKSPAQLAQRNKQQLACAFLKNIKYLIKISYQKSDKTTSAHEFISHLTTKTIKGTYPNQYIDYSLSKISRGKIPPPAVVSVDKLGTGIILSWKLDLRHAESLKNDHIVVLLINKYGESYIDYKLALRHQGTATLQLPQGFYDTVHLWLFYHNPDKFPFESREKISDSVYLGCY